MSSHELAQSPRYPLTSRTNHSCEPNLGVVAKEDCCAVRGLPFRLASEGDVQALYARRDIQPGEALTFS